MKLRIPIFIFALGVVSGIVQLINNNFTLSKTESYIEIILFFLILGVAVSTCERIGMNDKRVNLYTGISLIAAGINIDLFLLRGL
ncbi:hypothetical protein G5B47_15270 [Paenibacillus sp. 7124]|uniref:DUF3953 domain-containing protein n=1 Tax=Paenibacillus apii TaxID=1850370 RepID=A0A6M1PU69_9BACL|nr:MULTISPECIES: hypothetical protein [Paenibacillus]NGM83781.1 hypothetical protein [Paenibacillus apii]NJJ41116.1 hypothetical protein [Paenibacillus apii]